MKEYSCIVCHHIYDPKLGDTENGIEAGTAFEELPESWICPICGEGKFSFIPVEE